MNAVDFFKNDRYATMTGIELLEISKKYDINVNQWLKYQIDERSGDSSEGMHKQTLC
ncbi:MAG: hypothetical protein PHS30_02145 [Bacteroidales bacterium]|nr:hypothetical protein [Bacteroidales bacterium]